MTERILIVMYDGEVNRVYTQNKDVEIEVIHLDTEYEDRKVVMRTLATRLWNESFNPIYVRKYTVDDEQWSDLLI